MSKKRARRMHPNGDGPIVLMAIADRWVMVRRPGCIPFVMPLEKWNECPNFLRAPKGDDR